MLACVTYTSYQHYPTFLFLISFQDFSDFEEDPDKPVIVMGDNGHQVLQFQGMEIDLPSGVIWTVEKAEGEWLVRAPGKSSKWVKSLMGLKRARKWLVSNKMYQTCQNTVFLPFFSLLLIEPYWLSIALNSSQKPPKTTQIP